MFPDSLRLLDINCLMVAQVESLMHPSCDFSKPLLALSEPLFLLAPHLTFSPPSGLHMRHDNLLMPLSLHTASGMSPQGNCFLHNLSEISLHIYFGVSLSLLPKLLDDMGTLFLKACSATRHSSCRVWVEPSSIASRFLMLLLLFTKCTLCPWAIEVREKACILHSIVFYYQTRWGKLAHI